MVARLAYAHVGLPLPKGDAYAVPGFTREDRDGIKRIFSSMLFARKPLKGWPRGARELFESGTKLRDVVAAIQHRHAPLEPLWFTGVGHRLMFMESQVLVRILLRLIDRDITALPIHDCLVIAEPTAAEVEEVMLDTFEEITGQPTAVAAE